MEYRAGMPGVIPYTSINAAHELMNFFESLLEALLSLTMTLTPRIFERNCFMSLLGGAWAAAPWAALSYWLFTAPLSVFGVEASLLLRLLGSVSVLWVLAVYLTAWVHLYQQYRTRYETLIPQPVPKC
jgi:hypothetical protein